jgi:hypothetical protein
MIICGHSHLYERSRLMHDHFGMEATFSPAVHNLSNSTALYDGSANSCPYIKDTLTNRGTMYVVSGSAGALGRRQETYPHDAMYYSYNELGGASMIEVNENRFELKWISADGKIRDHFVMMKDVNKNRVLRIKKGESVELKASFISTYKWSNSKETGRTIKVSPTARKTVYEVRDPYSCLKDRFEVQVAD